MIDYFKTHQQYFWQWEENYEVIAIPKGSTIAYSEYIFKELFPLMVPNGLPPLGTLLLAMIALNPKGKENIEAIVDRIDTLCKNKIPNRISGTQEFLTKLANVPEEYKTNQNKIALLCTIFKDCHNKKSIKLSKSLTNYVQNNKLKSDMVSENLQFGNYIWIDDTRPLEILNNKLLNTEEIINLLITNPIVIPKELEVETSDVKKNKNWIDELEENLSTFTIGALIKRIWGGLNIPFQLNQPSDQPLGGVSDVTNKGNFDRLLISEYAHDDLVFLSRIANQEALYIHREIPPQKNDKKRYILIDISIRNWGTPKTLAYALALAMAKHPKSTYETFIFTLGTDWHAVYYDTFDDILQASQLTSTSLHAGLGMEKFFKEEILDKNAELIFISSKDSIELPIFYPILVKYFEKLNYWIQVDREGKISVNKNENKSKKLIQQFVLPLAELWKKPPKKEIKKENQDEKNEFVENFPMLFAMKNSYLFANIIGDEAFAVDDQGLLYLNKGPDYRKKGWELIYKMLPKDSTEIGKIVKNKAKELLVFLVTYKKDFVCVNVSRRKFYIKNVKYFNIHEMYEMAYHEDILYLKSSQNLYKIYIENDDIQVTEVQDIRGILTSKKLLFSKNIRGEMIESVELTSVKKTQKVATFNILSKIQKISLDHIGRLCFNDHPLEFDFNNNIYKIKTDKVDNFTNEKHIEAVPNEDFSCFTFQNGYTIRIFKNGMATLNFKIKEKVYQVRLLENGSNKLNEVKLIRNENNISLHDSKKLVDEVSSIIFSSENKELAEKFCAAIEKESPGSKTEIQVSEDNTIYLPLVLDKHLGIYSQNKYAGSEFFHKECIYKVQDMKQFWNESVQKFINQLKEQNK